MNHVAPYLSHSGLVDLIRSHGHDAWLTDEGALRAVEVTVGADGERRQRTISLSSSVQAVRDWLGY